MSLFRQTPLQKSTPKTVTLPNLYKKVLNIKDLTKNDKTNITKALKVSGYNNSTVSKMLSGKDIDIGKAKEIAGHLSKAGIKGFAKNDANKIVNKYVRGEAIKRKNITSRRREFMMEALQEDLYKDKTPGSKLNTGLSSPKPKSGGVKLRF